MALAAAEVTVVTQIVKSDTRSDLGYHHHRHNLAMVSQMAPMMKTMTTSTPRTR